MEKGKNNKKFWDRYARFYDAEALRFSRSAYTEMYSLMSKLLTKKWMYLSLQREQVLLQLI